MKNITITLDERTAGWARENAARRNISLSRYVGEVLNQSMEQARSYERARRHWLERMNHPEPLGTPGEPLPTRDEIYDRKCLR